MKEIKIGNGYDVHRLKTGRKLIIGGVEIPFEMGLDGHSDADVLAHAIIDSLFGACGLPDTGTHFPDSDPAYKGADSMKLLKCCAEKVRENGYEIGKYRLYNCGAETQNGTLYKPDEKNNSRKRRHFRKLNRY